VPQFTVLSRFTLRAHLPPRHGELHSSNLSARRHHPIMVVRRSPID
jgi:hypothetical protein